MRKLRDLCLIISAPIWISCSTFSPRLGVQDSQLRCLAEAIHGEARGETFLAKVFVGRTVLTRVSKGYGKNACEVVYAPSQFAPKRDFNSESLRAAKTARQHGPNNVTHFHSYKKPHTPRASFSQSKQCQYRIKSGQHWGFLCYENRRPASYK